MNRGTKTAISLLCLAFSVAGAYNVMSDNADVEKLAEATACASAPAAGHAKSADCKAQKTMMERNPLAQTFELMANGRLVRVRCARSWVLVGDYSCSPQ